MDDYLCEYWHNGAYWAVFIKAESREDAKERLKQMVHAKVLGPCSKPISAAIPGAGLWVRFEVWLRNKLGAKS